MKCNLDNIEINYEVRGTGKPILMLHGFPVDHRLMLGCMEPIFNDKSEYKRIYVDLPGMGETKGADCITNLDTMLEVVVNFIKKVISNENFLLAGQSFGGLLAQALIYKMKSKIDGLLLICPVVILDEQKRNLPPHIVLKKDDELLLKIHPDDAKRFSSIQVVQSKHYWQRFRDEILPALKIADINFLENIEANSCNFSYDIDNVNEKFDKPTLILLGRQDSCVGYKDALALLDKYPRAALAILDRAGHNLQIEQQELFNSLINEWLLRISDS